MSERCDGTMSLSVVAAYCSNIRDPGLAISAFSEIVFEVHQPISENRYGSSPQKSDCGRDKARVFSRPTISDPSELIARLVC